MVNSIILASRQLCRGAEGSESSVAVDGGLTKNPEDSIDDEVGEKKVVQLTREGVENGEQNEEENSFGVEEENKEDSDKNTILSSNKHKEDSSNTDIGEQRKTKSTCVDTTKPSDLVKMTPEDGGMKSPNLKKMTNCVETCPPDLQRGISVRLEEGRAMAEKINAFAYLGKKIENIF